MTEEKKESYTKTFVKTSKTLREVKPSTKEDDKHG